MKLGLVLQGGASRAYYSSGVLDALLEEGIWADFIIGTSAGIAYALSYVSGQKGRNLDIAKRFLQDKRYMGLRHLLNPENRCYFNLDFVFHSIANKYVPFDFETFSKFKGDVVATVTNVNTGQPEYLQLPRDAHNLDILIASCASPVIFPMVRIDGQPYMDGGISMPIPVEEAIRSGCDKNIVIMTRDRDYRKRPEKSLAVAAKLYHRYPNFSQALLSRAEIYNHNMQRLEELEKQGKVFVVAPQSTTNIKRTESSPFKIEELYNRGFWDLKSLVPELYNFINHN